MNNDFRKTQNEMKRGMVWHALCALIIIAAILWFIVTTARHFIEGTEWNWIGPVVLLAIGIVGSVVNFIIMIARF